MSHLRLVLHFELLLHLAVIHRVGQWFWVYAIKGTYKMWYHFAEIWVFVCLHLILDIKCTMSLSLQLGILEKTPGILGTFFGDTPGCTTAPCSDRPCLMESKCVTEE